MRKRKSKFPDPKPKEVFDGYTVIGYNEEESNKRHRRMFDVQCICGNRRTVEKFDLINHRVTNCGCIANAKKRDDEDITKIKFHRWTPICKDEERSKASHQTIWKCQCDCGNIGYVHISYLKNGKSKSCGCLEKELRTLKAIEREKQKPYHKEMRSRYRSMCDRCFNKRNIRYIDYGMRGITVCDKWLGDNGFENFYNDMINGFEPELTLDRIDVNKNYSPNNCRWIYLGDQGCNTRRNNMYEYYGMIMCASRLGEFNNAKIDPVELRGIINQRLAAGWTIREAINKPIGYNGYSGKDEYFEINPLITKPFIFTKDIPQHVLNVVKFVDYDSMKPSPEVAEQVIERNRLLGGLTGYKNITF